MHVWEAKFQRLRQWYVEMKGLISMGEHSFYIRSLHIEPTQIDQLGRTALHCAVISGSLNSVKALIECKVPFHSPLDY